MSQNRASLSALCTKHVQQNDDLEKHLLRFFLKKKTNHEEHYVFQLKGLTNPCFILSICGSKYDLFF
jgi:hypothetical protein